MKKGIRFSGSFSIIALVLIVVLSIPHIGYATDLKTKANSLSKQLDELEDELSQTVAVIEETAKEIEKQKESLSQAEADKQKQYEDMKLRIQYMYENGGVTLLQIIAESESLASLQANIEYIQTITEYDNEMLEKYKDVYREVEERDASLQGKRNELAELQTSLEEQIASVQSALSDTNNAIVKEKQAALEAELARAQELAGASSPSQPKEPSNDAGQPTPPQRPEPAPPSGGNSGSSATYTLSQFLSAGRISWNGYTFTYYSQSVLPGTGLNIPGRHVNADGYVSDGSGYICLAGSAPIGTVFATPFGYQGKIYDRGTSGNHLDVYIR